MTSTFKTNNITWEVQLLVEVDSYDVWEEDAWCSQHLGIVQKYMCRVRETVNKELMTLWTYGQWGQWSGWRNNGFYVPLHEFSRWTCTHVAMAPVSWYQVGRIGRHLQQVIDGPGAVRRTTYKEMDYWEKTDNGSVVWPAESEVTTHQCYHIQKNILIDKWTFITIRCEASKIECKYSTELTGVYPLMCAYTSRVLGSQQQPFKFVYKSNPFWPSCQIWGSPTFPAVLNFQLGGMTCTWATV